MPPAPAIGSVVGRKYQLVRQIGEGGMGAVFEARNTLTKKRVALKWLHADTSANELAAARLLREAEAAARVRHPHVVDVYDVERDEGGVFLVMEFLEGETLTALLRKRTLSMHEAVALVLQAASGVAAAHREGIVHRDVKPDNIFVARYADHDELVAKVLDFGISKLDPRGAEQLTLTKTGATVGTPLYMSYEQLAGTPDVDARTDVYAFGVILYEALTGRPPFEASTYSELILKVATQSPLPPKTLRSDIPRALEEVVVRAMAKDRSERTPTLEVLIRELQPFASQAGFSALMTLPDAGVPSLGAPPPAGSARLSAATAPEGPSLPPSPASAGAGGSAANGGVTRPQERRRTGIAVAVVVALSGAAGLWTRWTPEHSTKPQLVAPPPPVPTGSPVRAGSSVELPPSRPPEATPVQRIDEAPQERGGAVGGGQAATRRAAPPAPSSQAEPKRSPAEPSTRRAAVEVPVAHQGTVEPAPAPAPAPASGPAQPTSATPGPSPSPDAPAAHRVYRAPKSSEF